MPAKITKMILCETTMRSMSGRTNTLSDIRLFLNGEEVARFANPSQAKWSTSDTDRWSSDALSLEYSSLLSGKLTLGVTGDDEWRPSAIMIWGVLEADGAKSIVPIADRIGVSPIGTWVSQDVSEGADRLPLSTLSPLGSGDAVGRIVLYMDTSATGIGSESNSGGTDAALALSLFVAVGSVPLLAHRVVLPAIHDYPPGQGNSTYLCSLDLPRFKNCQLTANDLVGITITNESTDFWRPFRALLFAFDGTPKGDFSKTARLLAHSEFIHNASSDPEDYPGAHYCLSLEPIPDYAFTSVLP